MAGTNNSVNVSLVGQTGTGSFVGATSPTIATPTFTGTPALTIPSVTFSTTTGIVGTTTNNNAAAGSVGEFVSSIVLGAAAVSLTTNVSANITSLVSLSAGDWDIWGSGWLTVGATTVQILDEEHGHEINYILTKIKIEK